MKDDLLSKCALVLLLVNGVASVAFGWTLAALTSGVAIGFIVGVMAEERRAERVK